MEFFIKVIIESPFYQVKDLHSITAKDHENLTKFKKYLAFNSFEVFVHAFTNIGVLLMNIKEYELANKCFTFSVYLLPENPEAYINLNNTSRLLGRKEEVFDLIWNKIEEKIKFENEKDESQNEEDKEIEKSKKITE
jgi:tetratricopeptide (TPR) repeat protein